MSVEASDLSWQDLLPATRGVLPGGELLYRTEVSSAQPAPVLFLGVYPAATRVRPLLIEGARRMLPFSVERTSFQASSASGREINRRYLMPLGLTRTTVTFIDLVPYFLANTTRGKSGRTMADNVRAWERSVGRRSGIVERPSPRELVSLACSMPGNVARLRSAIAACRPRLLVTLGAEPAAFVRNEAFAVTAGSLRELFYRAPEQRVVLGVELDVVHLVHPHVLMKQHRWWQERHETWCASEGRAMVQRVVDTSSIDSVTRLG